ncbi:MAG TPA: nitroreductase family deazaflavin-dependent oxidoreductase [Acetobacteraceae bacterium]|nr:nitroreductase family deazaflavin-dependent oxidoreductase [Acetobacteraceae bacterium]
MMRKTLLRVMGGLNTWIYRSSKGRLLGRFPSGAPVCLLTTIGRRSGQPRTVPLLYLQDGADYVVVASQGGAPEHPGWFHNLQVQPRAEIELGTRRLAVIAQQVSEAERNALWPRLVAIYPPYETYQRRTTRRIPVLRLTPVPVGNATP